MGKTHSLIGRPGEQGLLPRLAAELLKAGTAATAATSISSSSSFEVRLSAISCQDNSTLIDLLANQSGATPSSIASSASTSSISTDDIKHRQAVAATVGVTSVADVERLLSFTKSVRSPSTSIFGLHFRVATSPIDTPSQQILFIDIGWSPMMAAVPISSTVAPSSSSSSSSNGSNGTKNNDNEAPASALAAAVSTALALTRHRSLHAAATIVPISFRQSPITRLMETALAGGGIGNH
jgi:hypothetical protein